MPARTTIGLDVWKSLFAAAGAFTTARCWENVDSDCLFGVRPGDRPFYCSILGFQGDIFGMAVYFDPREHLRLQKRPKGDKDAIYSLQGLVMYLGTKAELDAQDLRLIAAAGFQPERGKWPQFRSLRPGFMPWYLERDEAILMTACLVQAREISRQAAQHPDLLAPDPRRRILVRVAETGKDGLCWRDSREPLAAPKAPKEQLPPPPVNQFKLRRAMHTPCRSGGRWEIDYFHLPAPVQDEPGSRPYYPYCVLIMDTDDGTIVGQHLAGLDEVSSQLAELFLDAVIGLGLLPAQILFRHAEVQAALAPLTGQLGDTVEWAMVKKLRWASFFRRGLEKDMRGRF